MAGQHPSRRQVLEALGLAAVAASADGFCRWNWAFAQTAAHHGHMNAAPPVPARPVKYKPVFFSPAQYATVEVLAELILPATPATPASPPVRAGSAAMAHAASGTPHHPQGRPHAVKPADAGATDAGVAEFIDFMASQDTTLHDGFQNGLKWLDTAAGEHGFVALPASQQTALLERVAYKKNFRPEDKPGQEFFLLMRKYTVMGFYTSRIGMESLDYPGLRFYAESPSVPQDAFLRSLGV